MAKAALHSAGKFTTAKILVLLLYLQSLLEHAFFDPSILTLLYFPDDQK